MFMEDRNNRVILRVCRLHSIAGSPTPTLTILGVRHGRHDSLSRFSLDVQRIVSGHHELSSRRGTNISDHGMDSSHPDLYIHTDYDLE